MTGRYHPESSVHNGAITNAQETKERWTSATMWIPGTSASVANGRTLDSPWFHRSGEHTPSPRRGQPRMAWVPGAVSASGVAACGYYAQVPHYISGPYPAAAVALLEAVGRHVETDLVDQTLIEESQQLRERLDAATALEDTTRQYVERLESMVDEERLPSGDDLISEIEQFLRDRGSEGRERT